MENHHFQWENSLQMGHFRWLCWITRGYIIIILLLYYYYDINVAITCLIATGDQCGDFFGVLEIPLTDRPFWGYFPIGDHILHDSVAKVTRSSAVWGLYFWFIPHPHVTTEKIQNISACLLPSSILTKKPWHLLKIGVGRLVKALNISENKFLFRVKLLIYPMGNHYKSVFITINHYNSL